MKKVAINSSGGGVDTGSTGNGIIEKDMSLSISEIIRNILESKGVEVLMLRSGDETISYDDRIKNLKAKYPNKDDVIVLSNTLNSGSSKGIEIIYALNDKDTLAKNIGNNLDYFNDTRYFQYRWPTDTTKDYYYLTRNTPGYETIIVRYGYVNNADDASILKDNYEEMARSVADAILEYIGVFSEDYYIVKKGDTLYSIAKKYNTTVNEIKSLNNLTSNALSINQKLQIPTVIKEEQPELDDNLTYYTVKKGDTLYSIAKKYGMSVDKLKDINNLSSNLLNIGQLLNVSSLKKYTVVKGDTLYAIAKKYNTTVDKLMDINNLKSSNLSIGTILYIP